MKNYYKQRKKKSGISKANKSLKSSSNNKKKKKSSDDDNDYDESEMALRKFDMDMAYGPCLGMTRIARWERAHNLGLNPPNHIQNILKTCIAKVQSECLWYRLAAAQPNLK